MSVVKSVRRVSWIGTGVMGLSMLRNLVTRHPVLFPHLPRICDNENPTSVFTRTRAKAQPLIDEFQPQMVWANSPSEAARDSDVVFMIVGYPRDVKQVASECISVMKPGSVLIDLTTSEPALAREIHEEASRRGVFSLDIPVSGGDIGAREARLTMFVGGAGQRSEPTVAGEEKADLKPPSEVAALVEPLLLSMGRTVNYMGEAGMGQHAKMANQIKIASTMVGVVECMLYAERAGLDVEQTVRALGAGAAQSFSLDAYAPRILRGDMQPGFFVEHFLKDLEIALAECRDMRLVLPGLTQAKLLYEMLRTEGKERLGTQALALVLKKMNTPQEKTE